MRLFDKRQINYIIFFWIIYFSYYLARYDMSVAKVGMGAELSFNKEAIGFILSLFTFAYAFGQIVHGYYADKISARAILIYGIAGSLAVNFFIYFNNAYWIIALLWLLNGFFQSTGWAISSKAVGKVLSKSNRAIGFGVWGTCYQVGGAVAIILAGFVMQSYGWRYSFLIPSLLLLVPLLLVYKGKSFTNANQENNNTKKSTTILFSVLKNKNMVFIMLAYMFLGFIRYSFINWGIEYQNESLKLNLANSFINLSILPLGGIVGVVAVGVISDRLLKSKRANLAFLVMILLSVSIICFMSLSNISSSAVVVFLALIGALIAAGDSFIGTTTTMEFSKSDEEGHSIGVVDAFMYVGAISAGYLNGFIIQNYGWTITKYLWISAALMGAIVLLPLIKREKNGQV